jgi:hypothetical protein
MKLSLMEVVRAQQRPSDEMRRELTSVNAGATMTKRRADL